MKKQSSKLGLASCMLLLVPIIGFIAATSYSNAHPGTRDIPMALTLFVRATTGIVPVIGLVLGVIGLFRSVRRAFPAMGIVFNALWIIFAFFLYVPEHPPTTKTIRVMKIESMTQVETTDRGPALAFNYYTDLGFDDMNKLQGEAEDVWANNRSIVEYRGYKTAFVCPSERPVGFISKTTSYWFCYEQQDDGSWELVPENK